MNGRMRARITRMRDTLIKRENEKDAAEEKLKAWMKANMKGAGREAIGQTDKILYASYEFHKGLCEAYHKADHDGSPLEGDELAAFKERAIAFLNAEKAYDRQQENLRGCIMEHLRTHDTVEEIDSIINMLPSCYLRFNLYERKFAMEEEKNVNV